MPPAFPSPSADQAALGTGDDPEPGVKDSFAQDRNDSLSGSGADHEEKLQ